MSYDYLAARKAVFASPLPGTLKLLALALVEFMPRCEPSLKTLASMCGADRRAVMRRVALLERLGWLSVERGRGVRNRYQVLSPVTLVPPVPKEPPVTLVPPVSIRADTSDAGTTPPVVPMATAQVPPVPPEAEGSEAEKKAEEVAPAPLSASRRKRRGPLWHFVPPDWEPKDSHRREQRERGWPDEFFQRVLKSFRNHEFAQPKSDPDRTFTVWMTREKDPPNGAKPPLRTAAEALAAMGRVS